VVVTRSREQAEPFADALAAAGAEVVLLPTIATRPADDPGPLDRALRALHGYDWAVFTSTNAVRFTWDRMVALGIAELPTNLRIAAVGRATARALEERGARVDAVPDEFVGVRIAEAVGDLQGRRALLPRADIARAATVEALEAAGARVEAVTAYHTIPTALDSAGLQRLESGVDAITFTSPSTFTNLVQLLGPATAPALADVAIASIGPVTSAAIRAAGYAVHVEPEDHTTAGLLAALDSYFASRAAGVAGDTP
jgi:uroporphyrinogen III methyltransferase/synthase